MLIVTILRITFPSLKKCIFAEHKGVPLLSGLRTKNDDQKVQDHPVRRTNNIGYRNRIHRRPLCASHADAD
jgi:hypothetical protein